MHVRGGIGVLRDSASSATKTGIDDQCSGQPGNERSSCNEQRKHESAG